MGILFRLSSRILIASTLTGGVFASVLPSRLYTTQDGLVRNEVSRIRRDSRGYLWYGTWEGLSIFDGYQFTNYTVADGLPSRAISDILETRSGEYWIATAHGLCRFDPRAPLEHRFTPYDVTPGPFANQINVLIERRNGVIWFGTEGGLWRLQRDGGKISAQRVPLPAPDGDAQRIFALWEDREDNLWAASSDGLYVIWRDGRVRRFVDDPQYGVLDVLQDRQGRIWALNRRQVCLIDPYAKAGQDFVKRAYKIAPYPTALFESSDGKLWVATKGLYEFNPDAPGVAGAFQQVAAAFGGDLLGPLAEDADHNLWVAGSGAMKVTRHGFTTFSTTDGLKTLYLTAINEDRAGRLCAITSDASIVTINQFDGRRFTSVSPEPPGFEWGWGDAQVSFQDHLGDWWLHSVNGLFRFAPPGRITDLAQAHPKAIYTSRQGLPSNVVLRLFEDSRGDVWIGVYRGLAVWRRSTGRIEAYSVSDGLRYVTQEPADLGTPLALAEDRAGQIWIGFHPSGLARYRNRHFDYYTEADGLPKGQINGLYSDRAGRLWVASSQGGAARIDDVSAPRPSFRAYTIAQGLSSSQIFNVTEDRAGRIYLGGGQGVDRVDPDSGSVRHFTAADGLPPMRVVYSHRDHSGALWFGGPGGLARYVPEPDEPFQPQPPLIRALRIAGRPAPVSGLGESSITGLNLPATQNNLRIEFASLHFASGEVLRYQYRLEGADDEWSPPTDVRTVNYSSLSPGRYRFVVRAVNGEGLASRKDATIDFVILPPVWRRAWFIGLMMSVLAAVLYAGHRYRVQQLLRLERIRTRLASDLHDDIGSGLAEIAILTDVAEVQPVAAGGDLLRRAGDRARQLREAMSDIVWSVDPQHGNLVDLVGRVRQTVFSLMESNGTRVTLEAPVDTGAIGLAPDCARNVLLITKEALTNVLRHANASEVSVILRLEHRTLTLEVRDDGCGFEPARMYAGMGLRNLRRRAAESGGELGVDSSPGRGTTVLFRLPVD